MLVWVKTHTLPKTSTRVTQTSSPTPTSTWSLLDLNQKERTTVGAWRSITRSLWAGEARQSWSATSLGEGNWCKTYDPSISLLSSQLAKSWQMNFGCKGWSQFARSLLHLKTPQRKPKPVHVHIGVDNKLPDLRSRSQAKHLKQSILITYTDGDS